MLSREEYVADRFSKSSVAMSSLSTMTIDWPITLRCTMPDSRDTIVAIYQAELGTKLTGLVAQITIVLPRSNPSPRDVEEVPYEW